jgi:hypothetical protein
LAEVWQEMEDHRKTEIFQLRQTIEKAEAMGGDPLGELAKQLMQEISERRTRLNTMRRPARVTRDAKSSR